MKKNVVLYKALSAPLMARNSSVRPDPTMPAIPRTSPA